MTVDIILFSYASTIVCKRSVDIDNFSYSCMVRA